MHIHLCRTLAGHRDCKERFSDLRYGDRSAANDEESLGKLELIRVRVGVGEWNDSHVICAGLSGTSTFDQPSTLLQTAVLAPLLLHCCVLAVYYSTVQ